MSTFNPESDEINLTPDQIQDLLEDMPDKDAVKLRMYVGDIIRVPDGMLPTGTPVLEDNTNLYTPTNLIINKEDYDVDPSVLLRVQEVLSMDTEQEKQSAAYKMFRAIDNSSKYADADVYYLADHQRFSTPDGINVAGVAVYRGDENAYCILRDVDNDFYIRKTDKDTRFDGMRECTYAEYNPWHKDISEAMKQKGPEKINMLDLKLEIVDRQLSGGVSGKYATKDTQSRPDFYEKSTNKEISAKVQEDKSRIELQQTKEKEMIRNNNLRASLMDRIQENKVQAENGQEKMDQKNKEFEQSRLDRLLFGKRGNQ